MSNLKGFAGRILRVDLSTGRAQTQPLDPWEAKAFMGGRGLNAWRLVTELPPGVDPLGPGNKLLIATGPLVGTEFPTASRLNVSARSPLTGIFGDTNVGGHFASEVKYAGYDQIILEGKAPTPGYLYIRDGEVEVVENPGLWGLTVSQVDKAVKRETGDPWTQTLICGPAAEKGVLYAGLFINQHRAAARTGMGAVLASKNLKAVAVRGTGAVEVAQPEGFQRLSQALVEEIRNHEQYPGRRLMGTTRILTLANRGGFLPTRNYTQGVFEHAERVSGERLAQEFNVKTRGCFACTIPCSRVFSVPGPPRVYGEGPEYEGLGSLTSRIGNPSLERALEANKLCNELGLDILSTAGAIAWAMELWEKGQLGPSETGGLDLSWGNMDSVIALIHQIAQRRGFGDTLADGTHRAAEKLGRGWEEAIHVKGMDLIMADPRGLKGFGLGYAVATRGGDHLRSEPFIELSDDPQLGEELFGEPGATLRRSDRGKGKLVHYFEDWCAVIDSLEACKNIMQNMMLLPFPRAAQAFTLATGLEMEAQEAREVGERVVTLERLFGAREGLTRRDDTLPSRFTETPLERGASRGTVLDLEAMLDEYYESRGWDPETGLPTRDNLERLGLGRLARQLPQG